MSGIGTGAGAGSGIPAGTSSNPSAQWIFQLFSELAGGGDKELARDFAKANILMLAKVVDFRIQETALHYAVFVGSDIVLDLIKHGADVNAASLNVRGGDDALGLHTPLFKALEHLQYCKATSPSRAPDAIKSIHHLVHAGADLDIERYDVIPKDMTQRKLRDLTRAYMTPAEFSDLEAIEKAEKAKREEEEKEAMHRTSLAIKTAAERFAALKAGKSVKPGFVSSDFSLYK